MFDLWPTIRSSVLYQSLAKRPMISALLAGVVAELLLWWIYASPAFSQPPVSGPPLRQYSPGNPFAPIDPAQMPGRSPEWVLPIAVAVALCSVLAFTLLALRQLYPRFGKWHGAKIVIVVAGSIIGFSVSLTILSRVWLET